MRTKRTARPLRLMTCLGLLLLLPALTGCSFFGIVKKSTAVTGRPMTENVDIIGAEAGEVFQAPVAGALFSDTFYIEIREAVADGKGGEVYPVRNVNWFPLAAGDTIAVPVRSIFGSERWQKYGMRFRLAR